MRLPDNFAGRFVFDDVTALKITVWMADSSPPVLGGFSEILGPAHNSRVAR